MKVPTLLELATEHLDLGDGGDQKRKTRLGHALKKHRDQVFGEPPLEARERRQKQGAGMVDRGSLGPGGRGGGLGIGLRQAIRHEMLAGCSYHRGIKSPRYALFVTGEVVVRVARLGDARAIAEVSVASRRWSYRDLLTEPELAALSVEETTADFAHGLAELPAGAAVFVAEGDGRVVGYAYVLPSPDADVPAGTSELGSLYVTEEGAGTGVAQAMMEAALDHARAARHSFFTSWVRRENGRARRFYEKQGLRPDGGERSGRHDVLPIEIHEVRYRMSLEHRGPSV